MKKKVIVLILILFFITGCEAVYNIDIDKTSIQDELSINNYDKSSWNEGEYSYHSLIDNAFKNFNLAVDNETPSFTENPVKLPGYEYYNKSLINEENNYGLIFDYKFKVKDYYKTPLLGYFKDSKVTDGNTKIVFDSGDPKGCSLFDNQPDLEKLTINIKTNYISIRNNADKVEDNIYTWVLTKDNYKNKNIHLELDKIRVTSTSSSNPLVNILLISAGIAIIFFLVITTIKVKKSNK